MTADTGERAVEVVARAIRLRVACHIDCQDGDAPPCPCHMFAARASLTALHEAGLAVVPVEPTEAMLVAAAQAQFDCNGLAIYRAMLAAAQKKEAL